MPVIAVATLVPAPRLILTTAALIFISSCSPAQPMEESVRIAALRDSVRAGNARAVEHFIDELKAHGGTPLVEKILGDAQYLHVTFVWQGNSSTREVLIDWYPFTVSKTAELSMIRMDGTSLWHRTIRVPRGSRFLYQLSVNDPRATIPNGTGRARPGPDPLNPRRDIVELPGAPAQPWLARREGVGRLRLNREHIYSRVLTQNRSVLVYTPPGWNGTSRAPSLILFDGEQEDGTVFASATVENLIHERKIPPIVIARIPNPSGDSRMRDLGCRPEFSAFLANELLLALQVVRFY